MLLSDSQPLSTAETPKGSVSILVLLDAAIRQSRTVRKRFDEFLFQSLFYWMLLSDPCPYSGCSALVAFQSLFYWMLLSDVRFLVPEAIILCFNPCFIGCCYQTV